MSEQRLPRKLAAILYADVAGYSRLTGEDEDATHRRLSQYLDLISTTIEHHRGRVMHYAGDAVLAMFEAVVDALSCAAHVQRTLTLRNGDLPEERRIRFRIGVNLGDVIEDRGDIYGDGVNVAARLESLAEPGGICISEAVHASVGTKLPFEYEFLGEQHVKNIARPVRVYRATLEADAELLEPAYRRRPRLRPILIAVGLAALLLAVGATIVWLNPAGIGSWSGRWPQSELASVERPSIAVLPFRNLSTEPEQDYFSDGITNDIITDLSRFRTLFVIASNSTFVYKNTAVNVQQVGRELGVRYVLEGTVQKSGGRVRINAQLNDVSTGGQLWAERYDKALEDVFEIQEEIAKHIVRTLAVRITRAEQERAASKPTNDMAAYDYVLRGDEKLWEYTRRGVFEARELFRKAIALDPEYASAYARLGYTYMLTMLYGWTGSPTQALARAEELALQALALDDAEVTAHRLLGRVYLQRRQYDPALLEMERAIALNPNDADSYASQGVVLTWSGRLEGAVQALEMALKFDPRANTERRLHLGMAYYLTGQYAKAIDELKRGVARTPDNVFLHITLAAAYGQLDQQVLARQTADTVRRLDPFFEPDGYGALLRDPAHAAHIIEGLRKAGF